MLCFGGLIVFGAIVKNTAEGYGKYGTIGRIAYGLASVPGDLRQILNGSADNWMAVEEASRFPGRAGWEFAEAPDGQALDGYVLLSRYDGDVDRAVIELVNLETQEADFGLVLRPETLFADAEFDTSNEFSTPWIAERFRAIHPLLFENGDLLIKDHYGPVARVSACGDLVWLQDDADFHHSSELDEDGSIWMPTRVAMDEGTPFATDFDNMGIAKVSADGALIYQRSLGDVLIKAGLGYLIYSPSDYFEVNPMHLNDIQPVTEDGPFWNEGDLLLSLRNISTIMLFRPSTDQIIWVKRGPWHAQHDVDVIDGETIAVWNNDTVNYGYGPKVRGANKVTIYNLRTEAAEGPFNAALAENDVRTKEGGLFSILPNGRLMVEETGAGRLVIMDRAGTPLAQYFNRAKDGKLYHLGWSRYLPKTVGDRMADVLASTACN